MSTRSVEADSIEGLMNSIITCAQEVLDENGAANEIIVGQGNRYGSRIKVRNASFLDRFIKLVPEGSIVVEARNRCDLYGFNNQGDWTNVRLVRSPLGRVDIELTDVEYRPFSGNREIVRKFWSDPEGGIGELVQAVIANRTDADLLYALSIIKLPLFGLLKRNKQG